VKFLYVEEQRVEVSYFIGAEFAEEFGPWVSNVMDVLLMSPAFTRISKTLKYIFFFNN